jgi:hypothetical protein
VEPQQSLRAQLRASGTFTPLGAAAAAAAHGGRAGGGGGAAAAGAAAAAAASPAPGAPLSSSMRRPCAPVRQATGSPSAAGRSPGPRAHGQDDDDEVRGGV